MTPNRVNRAHWPTKENRRISCIFWICSAHGKFGLGWHQMGPRGFFPTNPDLADILGRTDFDLENFYFWDFLGPKFLAWAHVGPTWAHPLWAPRGPTHFGPRVGLPLSAQYIQRCCCSAISKEGVTDSKLTTSGSFL